MLLNCGVWEDSWESLGLRGDPISPSKRRSVLNIHWKDWCWSCNSNTWPPDAKNWLIWKDPDAGKDWRQEEKGMTEDKMVEWHHQLSGHEFEQAPVVSDVQGTLACCSPWVTKSQTQLSNWTELNVSAWVCMEPMELRGSTYVWIFSDGKYYSATQSRLVDSVHREPQTWRSLRCGAP